MVGIFLPKKVKGYLLSYYGIEGLICGYNKVSGFWSGTHGSVTVLVRFTMPRRVLGALDIPVIYTPYESLHAPRFVIEGVPGLIRRFTGSYTGSVM